MKPTSLLMLSQYSITGPNPHPFGSLFHLTWAGFETGKPRLLPTILLLFHKLIFSKSAIDPKDNEMRGAQAVDS